MKWLYLVKRHHAPISIKTFECGNSKSTFKKILNINFGFDNFIHVEGLVYIGSDAQNALAAFLKEQVNIKKPDFLLHFKKKCYETMCALVATANSLRKKDLTKLSNKELKDFLGYFIEMYQNSGCFVPIFPAIGNRIETILREKLKEKNIPEEKIYILTFPMKENEVTKERIAILKIAAVMKKRGAGDTDSNIRWMIKKHVNKFSWIGIRWFLGKPITEKDLIERLKYLSAGNPEKELDAMKKKKHNIENEAKKLLSQLDKETKTFVAMAQEYVYLRTYRTEMINKAIGQIYLFMTEIGKRLHLSYQDIIYLLPEEINDGLDGKPINKEIIKDRKKGFASLYINKTHSIITGKELEEFKKKEGALEKRIEETEIKGIVACEGKAKGTVKIVLSIDEISKVVYGDILVAVMTFPAYIPAMEKAAAFVTDEGGILCHAATIAREMNKPCIIGTKTATKILKDGDLVEIDAEKGIVKKIK